MNRELSYGTPSKRHRPPATRGGQRVRSLAAALLVAGVVGVVIWLGLSKHLDVLLFSVLSAVKELPAAIAVPLLLGCEALCFVTLLPISPIHVGIGVLYGFWRGTALSWVAYTLGCILPFLLAKMPAVARCLAPLRRNDVIEGVLGALEQEPFKLIVCLRLSPALPSPLNSYLLGFTSVPLRTYLAASSAGCLPAVALYVYLGSLLDDLADLAAGKARPRSSAQWVLLVVGLAATVALVVYVSRVASARVAAARQRKASSTDERDGGAGGVPSSLPSACCCHGHRRLAEPKEDTVLVTERRPQDFV